MPLRRSQLSTYTLLESFWSKKIQNIIATFPPNERHWPLDTEHLKKQIHDFAEKDPESMEETEDYYKNGLERIILTIAPDGGKSERFMFVVEPKNALATFYVIYSIDGGQSDASIYRFNCNVEATLQNIDILLKKFPDYHEHAHNLRFAQEKENKLIEIAEKSIESVIPQLMSRSGYEWHLDNDETRYILSIKMKKHKMIQISLTPKNFSEKISGILKVIAQIETLLDQIPYTVDIKSYGSSIPWKKG